MRGLLPLASLLLVSAIPAQEGKKEDKKDDWAALEKAVIELTNKERAKEKLEPLTGQALLTKAARGHSANMAKQGKLEHILDGKKPGDRVKEAGYVYSNVGENILFSSEKLTAEEIVDAWMKSPPHRENIMRPQFTQIGVGIARSEKGEWYFTQAFGRPRR